MVAGEMPPPTIVKLRGRGHGVEGIADTALVVLSKRRAAKNDVISRVFKVLQPILLTAQVVSKCCWLLLLLHAAAAGC